MEKEQKSRHSAVTAAAITALLFLVTAGVYGIQRTTLRDKRNESLSAALSERHSFSELQEKTAESKMESGAAAADFYQKLRAGEAVRILVLGDEFSASSLTGEAAAWTVLLGQALTERFGSEVALENLSLPGQSLLSACVQLKKYALRGELPVDAVLISFGYHENPFYFPAAYEGLLRILRAQFPESRTISLIGSAAVTNPEGYADETALFIRELSEQYQEISVNMGEAFAISGQDYTALTDGGPLPGKEGQSLYLQTLLDRITRELEQGAAERSLLSELPAQYPASSAYESMIWLPKELFSVQSERSFRITASELSALGISGEHYVFSEQLRQGGRNWMNLLSDGSLLGGYLEEYTDGKTALSLKLLAKHVSVQEELLLLFETPEQAEGFCGLVLCSAVPGGAVPESLPEALPLPEAPEEGSAAAIEGSDVESIGGRAGVERETEKSIKETEERERGRDREAEPAHEPETEGRTEESLPAAGETAATAEPETEKALQAAGPGEAEAGEIETGSREEAGPGISSPENASSMDSLRPGGPGEELSRPGV